MLVWVCSPLPMPAMKYYCVSIRFMWKFVVLAWVALYAYCILTSLCTVYTLRLAFTCAKNSSIDVCICIIYTKGLEFLNILLINSWGTSPAVVGVFLST